MTDTTSERRRPAEALLRRWPVAVAIGLVALTSGGDGSGDVAGVVGTFGEVLILLPLVYVIVTQIGRPGASWPVLGAGVAVLAALWALDAVSPAVVLVVVALVLLVWGALSGTPHGRAVFGIQAAGMLVFGAFALVGLAVDPDLGRYLVAAGWFFHGFWDLAHLRSGKVVARTYAEWCCAVDILVAAELAFLL